MSSMEDLDSDDDVFVGFLTVREVKYRLKKEGLMDEKYWTPIKDMRSTQYLKTELINFYTDLFNRRYNETEVDTTTNEIVNESVVVSDEENSLHDVPTANDTILFEEKVELTKSDCSEVSFEQLSSGFDDTLDEMEAFFAKSDKSNKIIKHDLKSLFQSTPYNIFTENTPTVYQNFDQNVGDIKEKNVLYNFNAYNSFDMVTQNVEHSDDPKNINQFLESKNYGSKYSRQQISDHIVTSLFNTNISVDSENISSSSSELVLNNITNSEIDSLSISSSTSSSSWETCDFEIENPEFQFNYELINSFNKLNIENSPSGRGDKENQVYKMNRRRSSNRNSARKSIDKLSFIATKQYLNNNLVRVENKKVHEFRTPKQNCIISKNVDAKSRNLCSTEKNLNTGKKLLNTPECKVLSCKKNERNVEPVVFKALFSNRNYKDIESPIARYIQDSPQVPLVKKVVQKTVTVSEHNFTAPCKIVKKFTPLPIRRYKPAHAVKITSEKTETKLPKNIEKLITKPSRPEIIKHTGRVNAENHEITESRVINSNIEDLSEYIDLETTKVAELSVMVTRDAKKSSMLKKQS